MKKNNEKITYIIISIISITIVAELPFDINLYYAFIECSNPENDDRICQLKSESGISFGVCRNLECKVLSSASL